MFIRLGPQIVGVIVILMASYITGFSAHAETASELDGRVDDAIKRFFTDVKNGQQLFDKAKGVLVFPSILKAGFGIGGEVGDGALRIDGKTVDYYNTAAASIGFQIGAQSKTVLLLFLEKSALEKFRASRGWEAGVDGSVALVKVGAGGEVDTRNLQDPIIGFVFSNKGLMYNLTLEGSKYTKIDK